MVNKNVYTLCGSTFLILLLRTKKKNSKKSESDIFRALLHVAFPDDSLYNEGGSLKSYTSKYKHCENISTTWLPLNDPALIEGFEKEFNKSYPCFLQRMWKFNNDYMSNEWKKWLISGILETINHDPSIKPDELFHVFRNKDPVNKEQLLSENTFELEPFLLGIWHFILTHRNDNTKGKDTFDAWHEPPYVEKATRKFKFKFRLKDINIISIPYPVIPSKKPRNKPNKKNVSEQASNNKIKLPLTKYKAYLDGAFERYSTTRTPLYRNSDQKLYDFYVCNNLFPFNVISGEILYHSIKNVTAETLQKLANFSLIVGTGGLGKSLMMQHLLLNAVNSVKAKTFGKIPVFIPLKDYSNSYSSIRDCIYEQIKRFNGPDNTSEFDNLLSKGAFLFLIDGFDEISGNYRGKFLSDLDVFTDKYKNNMFVLTSRPVANFSIPKFEGFGIAPFTKEQSLELINKLNFRPDQPKIKESFCQKLETSLFESHKEFATNPLLLTIMLMTYEQFSEIPYKMHVFYEKVYSVLSVEHDSSKGAYLRSFKTGLSADEIKIFFAEFCARSYYDEKFEFDDRQFKEYFNKLIIHKQFTDVKAADFKEDLVENLCIMYEDAGKYYFIHRSFQEYFCAVFFSMQKDDTLPEVGDFFANLSKDRSADKTFGMLYDMIPEKIETYIFEPFLEKLFTEIGAEENEEQAYRLFLQKIYPYLKCVSGSPPGPYPKNISPSFIYNFIVRVKHIGPNQAIISPIDPSVIEECTWHRWGHVSPLYAPEELGLGPDPLADIDTLAPEYAMAFGEPELAYEEYRIPTKIIFEHSKKYKEIIDIFCDNGFSIKQEYMMVREYFNARMAKHKLPKKHFFDAFI